MNTFYLIRHGETENNRAHKLSGWVDTPLTENGLEPTKRVIAKLQNVQFDALYTSDMGRAFITAYTFARGIGFTDEIIIDSGLREVNYGDAANMQSDDAYRKYPGLDSDTHFAPPNGESLDQMQQRVFATVDSIDSLYNDATIALVCHSGVMAALNAGNKAEDFGHHNISESYPHDYVGVFTYADGVVQSFKSLA